MLHLLCFETINLSLEYKNIHLINSKKKNNATDLKRVCVIHCLMKAIENPH